ncbi:MAG: T9SS type A sorting domain-containing protein [Elusimicrobia bacterium]|nr:T9SS type A sorting domain-containing protein [Elusimicrobiota bacterium]
MFSSNNIFADASIRWTDSGEAICTAASNQTVPKTVATGEGEYIITWQDSRGSTLNDIYAQKIDKDGDVQWTVDGKPASVMEKDQTTPDIISDGAGGAIITFKSLEAAEYDVYAQRLDSDGEPVWSVNGATICSEGDDQDAPRLVSDGSGGAIIVWQDQRHDIQTSMDLYAQKINSFGEIQWSSAGVCISSSTGEEQNPRIVTDGAGGAIIAWEDTRNGGANIDIYAQKVDSSGETKWLDHGIAVCASANNQQELEMVSDGGTGAILVWQDARVDTNCDIFAQKIDGNGNPQWTVNGASVCYRQGVASEEVQAKPEIAPDEDGGAIIIWQDNRNTGYDNYDIYAQRIDSSGDLQWGSSDVAVCYDGAGPDESQEDFTIASDGSGGAFFGWYQYDDVNSANVYCQRIDSEGNRQYYVYGASICAVTDEQNAVSMIPDGCYGTVMVWQDARGTTVDIYTQRISRSTPTVTGLSPSNAEKGKTLNVTVTGTGLLSDPSIVFSGTGITVNSSSLTSETELTANITVSGSAATGNRDMTFTNVDDQWAAVSSCFEVKAASGGDDDTGKEEKEQKIDRDRKNTVTLEAESGDIDVEVPAHTFSRNVTMTVKTAGVRSENRENLRRSDICIDIDVTGNEQPMKEITLRVHYRSEDIEGLDEAKLRICRYDDSNSRWIPLPTTVYASRNYMEATIDHLSQFGVLELSAAADLGGVLVFPNPYDPDVGSLVFDNLTSDATVKIYTISGTLVKELDDTDANGRCEWDGKNDAGETAASGVYIAYIKSKKDDTIVKIAVVK